MFRKRERSLWQIALTVVAVVIVFFFFRRPDPLRISPSDQVLLLDWARQQLTASASGEAAVAVPFADITNGLQREGSAFVSFYVGDQLRGCMIDEFGPHEPLYRNVLRNTALAAVGDDRFPPVAPDELADIRIVISLVGPLEEVTFSSPDDLQETLVPGLDGVALTVDGVVSAYLPWVWERFPDPAEFLSQLCLKQDLPADRWREPPYPRIEIFRTFAFGEALLEQTDL